MRGSSEAKAAILQDLAYAEGCYGGHQTLEAERLWPDPKDAATVNEAVRTPYVMVTEEGDEGR